MISPSTNGSRKEPKEHKNGNDTATSRSFVSEPNTTFKEAVSALQTLLQAEGEDTVMRAFAEAVWKARQQAFKRRYGVESVRDVHVCLHRLLGENCPDENCDSPLMIPVADHVSEWTENGRTVVIVAQPYGLSYEQLRAIVGFCEEYDLKATVGAQPSWHFPGSTITVEYRPTSESKS